MKQTKEFVQKLLWVVAGYSGLGAGVLHAHPGHAGHGISGTSEMFWTVALCAMVVAGVAWLCASGWGKRRGAVR